jgi:hypothetical protein
MRREHLAQVRFGIDAVEFGCADEAVDRGGAFATGIGAREQVVLATQGDHAQSSCPTNLPPLFGRASSHIHTSSTRQ